MHLLERRLSLSTSSWTTCNTTLEDEKISEVDLWNGGLTFHDLGVLLCAGFGLTAILFSSFLIFMHALHYSKPREQRHIIRILCMVPIYCIVSFLSFWLYRKSVYFQVLGDCYEAFAISAFFTLLCHYIAPDLHSQKEYFRGIRPKPWLWPVTWLQNMCGGERGCWRTPRSGLTWFNVIWIAIFQYCFIRVAMTIVAVATEAIGRYCEESLSPAFSHVWTMVIESIAVSIAMYCLIQFYIQIRQDVAQHSPFLKILAIKLVIFLSFWQSTVISFLTSSGAIKASDKVGTQDIKIGIPNLLICIEMALFSILHLWAFPWRPYSLANQQAQYVGGKVAYHGGPLGIKAFIDALNPWDLMKAVGRGVRWLFVGRRNRMQDPSYMGQTVGSYSLKPSDGSAPGSGPNVTAYQGAGAAVGSGRPRHYRVSPDEEGEELLSNAQPNPSSSYPPHSSGDIGLATTYYEEESNGRFYSHPYNDGSPTDLRPVSPQPYLPYNPYQSPTNMYPQGYHSEEVIMPSARHMPAPYLPPSPDDYDHNSRI
ncbi:hypothetical protein VTN77DRAFT_9358 [Rasamsonia byssochlamydoides]|uniref:uncharacterized protein n=1 Tax=Rasamsonia byssochlamydoides TaxID=89139 RepID=UPI0037436BC0